MLLSHSVFKIHFHSIQLKCSMTFKVIAFLKKQNTLLQKQTKKKYKAYKNGNFLQR